MAYIDVCLLYKIVVNRLLIIVVAKRIYILYI